MKDTTPRFIRVICALMAIAIWTFACGASASSRHYDRADEAFRAAQRSEQAARYCSLTANIADYYQIAIKNYKLALKEVQRSAEESEQLSEREKYNRQRIIDESRERIERCENRHSEILVILETEELKHQASKYIVAGFNYATADNGLRAKRSWNEAIIIYQKALEQTKDAAEQEVIKSKIAEVNYYINSFLNRLDD